MNRFFLEILSIFYIIKFDFVLKLKELKERQKQQLRQKAMKKGLDPE